VHEHLSRDAGSPIHIQNLSCDQRRSLGEGFHSGHAEAELHGAVAPGKAVNAKRVDRAPECRV
jgi:hypothetical protein